MRLQIAGGWRESKSAPRDQRTVARVRELISAGVVRTVATGISRSRFNAADVVVAAYRLANLFEISANACQFSPTQNGDATGPLAGGNKRQGRQRCSHAVARRVAARALPGLGELCISWVTLLLAPWGASANGRMTWPGQVARVWLLGGGETMGRWYLVYVLLTQGSVINTGCTPSAHVGPIELIAEERVFGSS